MTEAIRKPKRKGLSKKVRFEVFKRDRFTCQYCGSKAPEVILEVDHINPVSKGGDNDLMNLITSCGSCNSGKRDIPLSDDAAVQKQRAMLDELSERRDQLQMMLQWRDGLKQLDSESVEEAKAAWEGHIPGWYLNENGSKQLQTLLKSVPLVRVLDAIDLAAEKYLRYDADGGLVRESVDVAWKKIPGLAKTLAMPEDQRKLLYIRGICRNRFTYCNDIKCLTLLKEARDAGVSADTLSAIAKDARNWTEWQAEMYGAIEAAEQEAS